jgi:phosphohistidine phosphatase
VKSLVLLRHATPAPTEPGQTDFDRRLDPEGVREAAAAGRRIENAGIESPTAILCSSAHRTLDTLAALRASLSESAEISSDRELYCAPHLQILQCVREIDDAHASALVIGHNPGIAVLATSLAAKGDADAMQRMASQFPPASLVVLRLPADHWSEVRAKSAELLAFTTPLDF